MLDEYQTSDVTARAKAIAGTIAGGAPPEAMSGSGEFAFPPRRCPTPSELAAGMKLNAARWSIRMGEAPELDLAGVEQIAEHSQVRAIAEALLHLAGGPMDGTTPLDELLRGLEAALDREGLDALKPGWRLGNLARPRMLEVGAALSRLRSLRVASSKPPRPA